MPIDPEPASIVDARQGLRHPMQLATVLVLEHGARVDVAIRNLSTSGFLAVANADLRVGQSIRICIDNDVLRGAKVMRCDPPEYGCAFDDPISEHDLIG